MGFALRNIPVIDVAKDIDPAWSSALRSVLADLSMPFRKVVKPFFEPHGDMGP